MRPHGYRNHTSLSSSHIPRAFWVMVGLATTLALGIVLFLLVRGFQDGLLQSQAQLRQQVAIYLQKADDARSDGDRSGAVEAYRKVLFLDPENDDAVSGIREVLNNADEQPQAIATIPPAISTPTPTPVNALEVLWADSQALYAAGRWEEAIDRLRRVQRVDPNFEIERVEEMLFTAYVSLATAKSNAGSLEEAVTLFDHALALRPDAIEIRSTRDVTAQYVDALTYWHADWERVITLLTDLFQQNPGYRDVRQRLQQAYIAFADSLSRQGNWCGAAEQYGKAIAVQNGPGLEQKVSENQTLCEQNPEGLVDGEVAPPGTGESEQAALGAAPNAANLGTGRILYASQDPVDGRYRIYAQPVTASVQPVMIVEDAMHPALRSDGQRLAYRNMDNARRGLSSFDPATDLRLRFTTFAEDSFPSWNPEGNRLVFASDREGDRRWRLYVAWADGNDNGTSLGFGHDPDWHPSLDRIVYHGCDERGNACGLWMVSSSGADHVPLTNVPGDARPVWSPDGRTVVFMSYERSGNWEIYRLDVQTGAIIQLTKDSGVDGLPTVSPDGSRVAFVSNRDGSWKIWIKPITGGPEQPLAPMIGDIGNWTERKINWVP